MDVAGPDFSIHIKPWLCDGTTTAGCISAGQKATIHIDPTKVDFNIFFSVIFESIVFRQDGDGASPTLFKVAD